MGQPGSIPLPASSERILVADDDEAVSLFIEAVLVSQGYRVSHACNGEEAVAKYRHEGPFGLAILDVHMPKLDGLGALEQIRAFHPSVCGLVLSGMPVEDDQSVPGWAQGFDAFLAKLFDAADLVNTVRRLLHRTKPG